jgi:hypothetical protein
LPDISELTIDDIFPMSDDPSGSPISKKASMQEIVDLLEKGYFSETLSSISSLSSQSAASGYVKNVSENYKQGVFDARNTSDTIDNIETFTSATAGWQWKRRINGTLYAANHVYRRGLNTNIN